MSVHLNKDAWKRVAFGDVVQNINETVRDPETEGIDRVIAMEHLDSGELKVSRWGQVGDGTTFTRRVRPGQTIFGKRRAYQRKAAFAEFDAICSGDILVFGADETQLLPEFLPFLVQSDGFYDYALGTSAGSLSPRTNWRDLSEYEFDLPPLDDQRRISDLLWAIERQKQAAATLLKAAVHAMETDRLHLLCRGAHVGRGVEPLSLDAFNTWTIELPAGWTAKRIKDIAVIRSGATPSRSKNERYFSPDGLPWVKTLDLNEGTVVETDERITEEALRETSCRRLPAGTVLVAMYGGFVQIGRTARLGVDAATNQAVSALTELSDAVEPDYVHQVLKAGRGRWKKVAASTRKDPNITKTDIEGFEFPCPPVEEQREILQVLVNHEATISRVEDGLKAITALAETAMRDLLGRQA